MYSFSFEDSVTILRLLRLVTLPISRTPVAVAGKAR